MSKKQQSGVPPRRVAANSPDGARIPVADLEQRYTFRRNRTLTGSLSSDVSSVNEDNAELKSHRVHAHHLRRHRRRALGALLGVIVVGLGLFYLLSQSIISFKLTAVSTQTFTESVYQQKVQAYLQGHPLERFRFSFNPQSLATYLQQHGAPEVSSIALLPQTDGFGRAQLAITFRKPAISWQTGGSRTYVDTNGNSFTQNNFAEPAVQVIDQTGIQTQNNQVLASARFLAFIGKVVGRMGDNGYAVNQVILPANTTRQIQVRITGVEYPVKFSVDRPVGEQAEDAARAIRYLAGKQITLEYLDVRVSGKAYYK